MTDHKQAIAEPAQARARHLERAETATADLRAAVLAAINDGMTEQAVADLAGVTRMTIRAWLGKR